ncbi:ParB/RepB/Spo0J family partition protein [Rheinheimera hassiensis]|uniref:ParB/RepB/Spo0J family partition protein n=1 Tax=Rheinheimera hassiensis TaxID=1193627 RepID=UPI001F05A55F|nr:ParB/RepB/Spo0J family partition protein [Rheinheimera hassiensis]
MYQSLVDGDLLQVSPKVLKDLFGGGNIRRKRKKFAGLVEDIKANGIIQPVVVRRSKTGNELELIAGYGRREAAIIAELDTIPALFRDVGDETALLMHLKENTEREDLSIVDEVELARRFISFYNGDRKSAAMKLGWSVSRLSERLELLHSAPEVLSALDFGEILAGHALILSGFETKVQVNTLQKLISEKWSVNELRQRASRFQLSLAHAKFDKSECQACPHNTERQAGLFGLDDDKASCSKPSCFQEKTKANLVNAKAQAEERFGAVLWLSESQPSDRATVSVVVVGQAQFDSGCMGCEKRVAVIDDSPTPSAGDVLQSQCIDRSCFADCTTAFDNFKKQALEHSKVQDNAESKQVNSKAGNSVGNEVKPKSPAKEPVTAQAQTPQVAIDAHKDELRAISATHLSGNALYTKVLQIVGMAQFVGYPMNDGATKTFAKLMAMTEAQLDAIAEKITQYSLMKSTSFGDRQITPSLLLGVAATATADGQANLVRQWVPTAAILSKYRISGVIQLCTLSGFDRHFDNAQGEGSFAKLSAGKKGDFIKSIMDITDFDWSTFAPPAYLKLIDEALANHPLQTAQAA